jgi:hypothetical protein
MTAINSFVDYYRWNYQNIWQERLDNLELYLTRMDQHE